MVDCSGIGESRGCWLPSSIRRRRRCWSAACGLEIRSRLDDRERWRREDILQDLCIRGEGDLEDDREEWWLGALVRNGGDDWRPQDDRSDRRWDAGDGRRGDKDGCPASFLVLPASKGQPTRGSRTIPGPAVMRWWWGWRATATWQRWAWSPRKASPRRLLTTFRGAGPTGSMMIAQPWAFGGKRQASGRGGGVRRHSAVPDPVPMSVSRRSLTRTTALTDATVC